MQHFRIITSRGRGCGFFSHVFQVLGQIIECRKQGVIPIVFFRQNFAYWEKDGPRRLLNPWEYYFHPVSDYSLQNVIDIHPARISAAGLYDFDRAEIMDYTREDERRCSIAGTPIALPDNVSISNIYPYHEGEPVIPFQEVREMDRYGLHELVRKYVRAKDHICSIVNEFQQRSFRAHMVAIHIRGQEHAYEIGQAGFELAPPQRFFDEADQYLEQHPEAGVLVATESSEVADSARAYYGDRLAKYPAQLSPEGSAPHKQFGGYRVGEDVLVECLLMARCNMLIHGISEVPFAALYFNAQLPHINIYS